MKIDELIKNLDILKNKYGNLDVLIPSVDEEFNDINEIYWRDVLISEEGVFVDKIKYVFLDNKRL